MIFLQLASWLMMLVSFPLAGLVIWNIKETSYTEEKTVFVEDVAAARAEAGHGGSVSQHSSRDVKEKIEE